ncbi:MAG TPA: class I SAM-dependent methyltransferase [Bacteroidia bacterium]|jgi:16S rRNA (cytosine967-C5)-methyltransferase|nr:class I SAM-dependent methyltransferase [Bacteroidia bacterium]
MKKEFYLKHHSNHIKAIFLVLKDIFEKEEYADKAIEKIMRANKYWDVRERSFVSDVTYDIVRNWRLLFAASGSEGKLTEKTLWDIFGTYLIFDGYDLPSSAYFKGINEKKIINQLEKFYKIRKIRESVPDWLDVLGEKELGKDWDKVIRALNQPPTVVLRANSLKTTPKELQKVLEEEKITESSLVMWSPDAVELKFPRNVFRTEAFHKGLFEVQDASSQMVSDFLNVQPGMRVIDACAGAGGKTLHLAALMKNKGRIIALDVKDKKLQELKKRAARADVRIVETRAIDSSKVIKRLKDTADRLLLDVPCSGLGVLRRNPDSKWKLDMEEIERVKKIQRDILSQFPEMTKVGGKMVYATCSILPSEGEEQIKWFLEQVGNKWNLLGEKRYSPDVYHADGFYMALLERVN